MTLNCPLLPTLPHLDQQRVTCHIHTCVLKGVGVLKNVSAQTVCMNHRLSIVQPHVKHGNDALKQSAVRTAFEKMGRLPQVTVCAHKLRKGAVKQAHGAKRHGKCPGGPI